MQDNEADVTSGYDCNQGAVYMCYSVGNLQYKNDKSHIKITSDLGVSVVHRKGTKKNNNKKQPVTSQRTKCLYWHMYTYIYMC